MKEIMGMLFTDDKVPDFGSIRLTGVKGNVRKYVLKSEDIGKLDLITNAASGSTAICVDTSDVYIKHDKTWYKL